ncbi:class I mannose-6-phosphate isomerase [Candidatus Lokiarchaeum ossiferum]|uniref:class I mannose-6-phosphate isomerase n=1 Tax=Candidatus Lokiarchaeum ossiferum TaxID=2951803 RepID=UPI00352C7C6D
MKYVSFESGYEKIPRIEIDYPIYENIAEIIDKIKSTHSQTIVIECYPGIDYQQILTQLVEPLEYEKIIKIDEFSYPIKKINKKFAPYLTKDRIFGKMCPFSITDLYPKSIQEKLQKSTHQTQSTIIYGFGASLVDHYDLLIYIDISRWEIQQRFRRNEIGNWKLNNLTEDVLRKYKRSYFIEWRIADRLKTSLFDKIDYYIDGNKNNHLKMLKGSFFNEILKEISTQPFRLTPYFDPGVWGGQWMKEVCNLDPEKVNYAWSFDGVPEENSLTFSYQGIDLEMPALNLIMKYPQNLLGEYIYHRFGAEFPIRFDFLDTMDGQNLSLQVHPMKKYIQEQFGIEYTQDESYYILDSRENSCVYLGMKDGINPKEFITALKEAQISNQMDVERFVNKISVKKHDHILIPAGTVHGSGKDTMVLEISATPYIFTFKLWDWNRLDLDGKPRPINIDHGSKVIQFQRDTKWISKELVNRIEVLSNDGGVIEERTGLHDLEFIETRRYWFDKVIVLHTRDTVHVSNLVEGQQAIVESPIHAFDPFEIHYAETFIVPAAVGEYTIRPFGVSEGKTIGLINAYVRPIKTTPK